MIKFFIRAYFYLILLFIITCNSFAQETGYLIIESNLAEFLLVIDNDFENYLEVTSGDTLTIEQGERRFRMVAPNVNDNLFSETILEDEIIGINVQVTQLKRKPISSYEILVNQTNVEIFTDRESSIYINEKFIGNAYSSLFLEPGSYYLLITHPTHGSLKKPLDVSLTDQLLISRYNQNPKRKSALLNIVPGGGYLINKDYRKAKFTYATLGLLTAGIIYSNYRFDYIQGKISDQTDAILSPQNPELVLSSSNKNFFTQSDLERVEQRVSRLTLTAILVYGLTTIDGFRKPRQGYWDRPQRTQLSARQAEAIGIYYPELSLNIYFK